MMIAHLPTASFSPYYQNLEYHPKRRYDESGDLDNHVRN